MPSQARTMITTQTLDTFLTYSSLFILLSLLLQSCNANCTPSSCGEVRNISHPFRLSTDPTNCGDPKYELACENDVAFVYLSSQKYYVKEINYSILTIRVADASINSNTSLCSSPPSFRFEDSDVYAFFYNIPTNNQLINFISCSFPLKNSSHFTQDSSCNQQFRHTYIKVGESFVRAMENMCTLVSVFMTSWSFSDSDNVSVSEIRRSLLYGFALTWCKCKDGSFCFKDPSTCYEKGSFLYFLYDKWKQNIWDSFRSPYTYKDEWMNFVQPYEGPYAGCLKIFMLTVAVIFAGVTIPAKIVIGFGSFYLVLVRDWRRADIQRILVVSFAVRSIVGFLCAMGFLIYKFRRRHLSMYEDIECFLESDNGLMPIRYSYSDIRKITRGFREKLGEGGFGCVYKGKLRSGHHVAVKVLGKAKSNGQDFINEIATIGRIHHVNVVKLVGYCAERSKRALVFDFMPNGSLDKYIFNKEIKNALSWDTKFEIVVGVARGIEYLHRGCDIQILHFDIKPHNILLDDKFVPNVSDFGLAKFCSTEKNTMTMTVARGTIGYVAPELINRGIGRVSYKADVYSFGMLLMEMVGLNIDMVEKDDASTKYFPCWIYDRFNQGMDIAIVNVDESDNSDDVQKLGRKMTIVALWCIQMNPDDRPSMNKVLEMLEGDVERLQIPDYPSQSSHMEMVVKEEKSGSTSSSDSVSLLHHTFSLPSIEIAIEE